MGRKRTRLELTAEDRAAIDHHLNTTRDARKRERLHFAINASTGNYTLQDLARCSGRSRSTIQNWLTKFERGGLPELITRDVAPGKQSPLAGTTIQKELRQGMKCERWATAQQVSDWLKERYGVELSRKSVYYWIRKLEAQADR